MNEPRFFPSGKAWRAWLEKYHARESELLLGFHKAKSEKKGITYREALDEALCFGWIDAVRGGGVETWTIRFTLRKPRSIWSAVNIRRMEELIAEGRVHASGLGVYKGRDPKLAQRYSYENRDVALAPEFEKRFRARKSAWANFQNMPPSYRRPAIWWVMGAKQDATRERRLETLIADSDANRRVKHLTRPDAKR